MTTHPQDHPAKAAPSSAPEPAPAGPVPGPGSPLAVTHATMNAAYDNGEAAPLAATMTWLIRYQDSWWVVYERGWLRVTDTATAQDLDEAAARLAKAAPATRPPGSDRML
jgi:hypothetical protein